MTFDVERFDDEGQRFEPGMRVQFETNPDRPGERRLAEAEHGTHEVLDCSRFEVDGRRLIEVRLRELGRE